MSGEKEQGEEAARYLYCAKCGSRNIDQARFCQGCGRTIKRKAQETDFQQYTPTTMKPEETRQDPPKETDLQQRYSYCAKCGSRNINEARFCQGCGRTIKRKAQETDSEQYTPTTIGPEKTLQDITKETGPQQSIGRKITPGSTIVKKIGSGVTIARKAKNRATIAKTRTNQTTSLEIQYADFSERLLAAIIDGLLVIIVPFPVVIVSSWIGQSLAGGEDWGLITGFCIGWIFVLILAWIYYAIMESSSQQATLGKIVLGIIVTNHEKQRLSFGRASKRYMGKIISLVILGVGFIMIARTEKKQGLHDMIAGSFVVEKRHRSTRSII